MKVCGESCVEADYSAKEFRPTLSEFKNFSNYVYNFIRTDCEDERIAKVSFLFLVVFLVH